MPEWAGRNLKRLRHPKAVWVRVPAGVALTGGGVLSVLPGLGLWMLPVGLALLAHDVPVMRRRWRGCCASPTSRSSSAKSAARMPRHDRGAQG